MGAARAGQAARPAGTSLRRVQSGDALIQKLEHIAVALEEEEKLTLVDVTGRARAAFDVERVTKKFYDQFKTEHAAFLKFIKGITGAGRPRVVRLADAQPADVRLLHPEEGLSRRRPRLPAQPAEADAREHGQGQVPLLLPLLPAAPVPRGAGQAAEAKLDPSSKSCSATCPTSTAASSRSTSSKTRRTPTSRSRQGLRAALRLLRRATSGTSTSGRCATDNEINPDVLGYIFEKYINQKQMGAYYTKEDITEYIGKNTIIPFLFDAAASQVQGRLRSRKGPTVWDLLQDDPDRYIYAAVRHGVIDRSDRNRRVPESDIAAVAADVAQPVADDLVKRGMAGTGRHPPNSRLPTETWREHVARRSAVAELRTKLAAGEVHEINDLITLISTSASSPRT